MLTIKPLRFAAIALALAFAPACAVEDTSSDSLAETDAEIGARPTFDLWKNASGKFYFHLDAANGETLLSSQAYDTRMAAITGLLSVLDHGGLASAYRIKVGADGKHYVSLTSSNGRTIATGEGYATKQSAERGIETMVRNIGDYLAYWDAAAGARLQVKAGATGKFSFNLYAANGEIVLSSESYTTEAAALNGAFAVVENGANAARFEVKAGASGRHYFVLKAANGQIVGTSQQYATKAGAERGRDAVVALVASGAVELL